MQYEIFKFRSEEEQSFSGVRTIEEDGKIWFCGNDVASILGYLSPKDAIIRHCKSDGVVFRRLGVTTGKKADGTPVTQYLNIKFISEGNVYRLIARSKLPSAEKFEKWLFDEVVPSIRKTGYYGTIDRSKLPNFVKRFQDNMPKIPSNYFSVITEMYVRLYSELEKIGYSIPDKGESGKSMCPDISVGKGFAQFLRDHKSEFYNLHKTYKHTFPDGRVVNANMYPIEALPMFIRYINERWLFDSAADYFRARDPLALDYLPKLLETKRRDNM